MHVTNRNLFSQVVPEEQGVEHIKKQQILTGDLESCGGTHSSGEGQGNPQEVKKFTKQSKWGKTLYMKMGTACANYGGKQHMAF